MRVIRRHGVAALVGVAVCSAGIAIAQGNANEPVQVSSGATKGPQHRPGGPRVAAAPGGTKIVVWLQPVDKEVPERYQLWGRALDKANAPVGVPHALSPAEQNGQVLAVSSAAVERAAEGFLLLWAEGTGNPLDTELVARRLTPGGEPVGGTFTVAHRGTSSALAYDAERDEFLVVWDVRGRQIRARRLRADGAALGESFRLWRNPDEDGIVATSPSVAYDSEHERYLAVWDGSRGPDAMVFGRTITADGKGQLGRTRRLGPRVRSDISLPDVAFSPSRGEFLLASHDRGQVLLTRVDHRGRRVGERVYIRGNEESRASSPAIAAHKGGDHVLAYKFADRVYYRHLGRRLRLGRERRVWPGPASYESGGPDVTTTESGFGVGWVQALGEDDPDAGFYADREVFFRELSGRN